MSEPIARITDYFSLIAAFKARIAQLGINYATVDRVAGFTDTYTSKLLATKHRNWRSNNDRVASRGLARASFDAMIGTLGVAFLMIEDPQSLAKVQKRLEKRKSTIPVRADGKQETIQIRLSRRELLRLARLGGKARAKKLPAWKRRAIARKAAKKRWAKPHLIEVTK